MQDFRTANSNYTCYAFAYRPVYKRVLSSSTCTTTYFELPPASPGAQPLAARLREMADALGLMPPPTIRLATSSSSLNKLDEAQNRRRTKSQGEPQARSDDLSPQKSRSTENLDQVGRSPSPARYVMLQPLWYADACVRFVQSVTARVVIAARAGVRVRPPNARVRWWSERERK